MTDDGSGKRITDDRCQRQEAGGRSQMADGRNISALISHISNRLDLRPLLSESWELGDESIEKPLTSTMYSG